MLRKHRIRKCIRCGEDVCMYEPFQMNGSRRHGFFLEHRDCNSRPHTDCSTR